MIELQRLESKEDLGGLVEGDGVPLNCEDYQGPSVYCPLFEGVFSLFWNHPDGRIAEYKFDQNEPDVRNRAVVGNPRVLQYF